MKLIKLGVAAALGLALIATAWVSWNRPQRVDMADYAPADALVYLECNSLLDVKRTVTSTDAWREMSPLLEAGGVEGPGSWLSRLIYWTGIGPTPAVILTRAQLAMVMIDLGTKEEGTTLTFKPEAAILIETHTSERRMRPTVEDALRQLAEKTYAQPTMQKRDLGGTELIVWSAPSGDRQIMAAIDGTLVIVGNSERAVKACLDVHHDQRPSLRNDPELQQLRSQMATSSALAFGFVSSANVARLLSVAVPVLLSRTAGDLRFERILADSASRISTGIGWSSRGVGGGIEDRYLFSLKPGLVSRLDQAFRSTETRGQAAQFLPEGVHSVTFYNFEDPLAAWKGFESTVSSRVDTLSAMLFTSVFKSALTPYGIKDAEKFLGMVGPEVTTTRLTRNSNHSVLIATVRDEPGLRRLLLEPQGRELKRSLVEGVELIENPDDEIAVSFMAGSILIGPPEDVRNCIQTGIGKNETANQQRFDHFLPFSQTVGIVTYANDSQRVFDFFMTLARATGSAQKLRDSTDRSSRLARLPYSATETKLGDQGFERRTRSPLGQFSTLVPQLLPN